MSTAQILWAVCGITALMLLPVGGFRMIAYRSGEVDHTPGLRGVAVMALTVGGVALVGFLALSGWFAATGHRPW